MRNDIQRRGPEHLKFPIRQGLGRRDYNRISGMHAHRVQIFHGTDGNHISHAVPHGLELDFLPAENSLFNKHLSNGGSVQAGLRNNTKFSLVLCRAAARTAKGKGWPDNDRIADAFRHRQRVLDGLRDIRRDHRLTDFLHGLLEQLPVLGAGDGSGVGTQQPDVLLFQEALFIQLHGQRQTGLPPKAR